MSFETASLNPHALLSALNDNLNKRFFVNSRDTAKQLYQALNEGKEIPFMHIGVGASQSDKTNRTEGANDDDRGEVFCKLALDASEYVGKLNFSSFRKNLAMMLLAIKARLDNNDELNIMNNGNDELLFNLPGIVRSKQEKTNIMVCGLRQNAPGDATIRLMYLDPEKFLAATKKNAGTGNVGLNKA